MTVVEGGAFGGSRGKFNFVLTFVNVIIYACVFGFYTCLDFVLFFKYCVHNNSIKCNLKFRVLSLYVSFN